MLLKDSYFTLTAVDRKNESEALFSLDLISTAAVYKGHFPHRAVCPGVCNIETIRECAEVFLDQRLYLTTIKQCRLTAVATPQECPHLTVHLVLTPASTGYTLTAEMSDSIRTYLTLKAELSLENPQPA